MAKLTKTGPDYDRKRQAGEDDNYDRTQADRIVELNYEYAQVDGPLLRITVGNRL